MCVCLWVARRKVSVHRRRGSTCVCVHVGQGGEGRRVKLMCVEGSN